MSLLIFVKKVLKKLKALLGLHNLLPISQKASLFIQDSEVMNIRDETFSVLTYKFGNQLAFGCHFIAWSPKFRSLICFPSL